MKKGNKVHIRKLLLISKLGLISVLAYTVVNTAMISQRPDAIFTPRSAVGVEGLTPLIPITSTIDATEDYSVIVDRNIFGTSDLPVQASIAENVATGGPIQAAKADLGLKLIGIIAGDPALSRAIIKDIFTNVVGFYKTNDTIGPVSITEIETNRVLLDQEGERKILRIENTMSEPVETVPAQSVASENETATVDIPLIDEPAPPVETKMKYIEAILRKATVKPYLVAGKMQGLRLTRLDRVPFAKAIGLRNGDVIRTVNGQRLTSKQKAYQVFKKARSKPTMNIELLRGSETKKLVFDLR